MRCNKAILVIVSDGCDCGAEQGPLVAKHSACGDVASESSSCLYSAVTVKVKCLLEVLKRYIISAWRHIAKQMLSAFIITVDKG